MSIAQKNYWQQQVDNTISVTLNDKAHTLDGFIKITYTNHSPDTLRYIWFHLWPNAYKNDRTAFSEQMLQLGRTDFYFSNESQKGYINQLDFRVNEVRAEIKDHPVHQDIVQLILPAVLEPGQSILITSPFHVKIPGNFSRFGHIGQSYQITQWYPKPAVYDHKGWHPMPYLEQGEFYSEFGSFDVQITLPENYAVAATGELQGEEEYEWLKNRSDFAWEPVKVRKKVKGGTYKMIRNDFPASAFVTKTLRYKTGRVHDFAWFADKRFVVTSDTFLLASGKKIDLYAYFLPAQKQNWTNVHDYLKKAIHFYSEKLGEPAYPSLSIVQRFGETSGGMDYPSITVVQASSDQQQLEEVILRETGHSLLYSAVGSNEREHPWMDEGMLSYYGERYKRERRGTTASRRGITRGRWNNIFLEQVVATKRDQAIDLPAQEYLPVNYRLSVSVKASQWMKLLEKELGTTRFDTVMQHYYHQWRFKHPYPLDFKNLIYSISNRSTDSLFTLLAAKGSLVQTEKKQVRLTWLGKPDETGKYHSVGIAPALGYNYYDQLMIGGIVHNYTPPFKPFRFVASPLYAIGSKQLNGIARLSYNWYPDNIFYSIEAGVSAAKFTGDAYTDSANHTTQLGFYRLTPFVRFHFRNNNVHSPLQRYVLLKYYFIGEQELRFAWDSVANKMNYVVHNDTRSLAQVRFVTENDRALYPYNWELQLEAGKGFGRIAYTGNYFFNYPKGGGMNVRGFAGKFFYLGSRSSSTSSETSRYHLNMTAPKGEEDYTYSNYFIGRNEFEGFLSQQVMKRDGAFKVRTDLLSNKIGRTDNWLLAANFTSTIHPKLPVKLFFDAGTFSDAWESGAEQPRLLFDAGIQLSLLKDILHVYVPVVYSKVYRDYFRSTPGNNFWQRISFSIDIQHINFRKIHPMFSF